MQKTNRMKWMDRALRNTSFGIFFGAELTLFLCWSSSNSVADQLASPLGTHLTIGTTLAGSILALSGVLFTIENQISINQENRHKKFLASRAFLPHALSELSELCYNGMNYSFAFGYFETSFGKEAFKDKSIKDLRISDSTTSILKDIIEFSNEKSVSDRVSGILREHQILIARWKGEFKKNPTTTIRLEDDDSRRTVAWAYLAAICASMFKFSRGDSQIVDTQVTFRDISGIIATSDIAGLYPEEHAEAINLYARTFDRRFTV